jgi:hypothetical protein
VAQQAQSSTHAFLPIFEPGLYFRLGQRVIERWAGADGRIDVATPGEETEIISIEGRRCVTNTGEAYDILTGRSVEPPGKRLYHSIRSLVESDRKTPPRSVEQK